MDAIVIRDLEVHRGGVPVIRDLSLTVASGGVTGLLGPSGSGKSTLMRAIVGVQRVAGGGGDLVLGLPAGSPALQAPGRLRDPGTVGLRRPHRCAENLRPLRAPGWGRPTAEADRGAGRRWGLVPTAPDSGVNRMSGGQRTRVSLAVALLGDPAAPGARRADRGPRPGAAPRPLGHLPVARRRRRPPILVSSHVMDEAAECDMLLLDARAGDLVARRGPPTPCAPRTGHRRPRRGLPSSSSRRGRPDERARHPRHRRAGAAPAAARPAHARPADRGALVSADGDHALRLRRPARSPSSAFGAPLLRPASRSRRCSWSRRSRCCASAPRARSSG